MIVLFLPPSLPPSLFLTLTLSLLLPLSLSPSLSLSLSSLSPSLLSLSLPLSLLLCLVDKTSLMVGSYGPKTEPQIYTSPFEEAPSGMLSRGDYTLKSKFTDDDKNPILEWEWVLSIKKEWDN